MGGWSWVGAVRSTVGGRAQESDRRVTYRPGLSCAVRQGAAAVGVVAIAAMPVQSFRGCTGYVTGTESAKLICNIQFAVFERTILDIILSKAI